jgi:drug/metabolite transporter (DMT)-like permease
MSSTRQRPVSRRSAINLFYILALGSGLMRSLSVTFDIVAVNTFIPNTFAYGFMSQWVSFFVTLMIVVILSIPITIGDKRRTLGYNLDPDFGSLSVLPKEPMVYLAVSGFFAGISTFSYYTLTGLADASTVLPYGQLVILYLLLGDLLSEKDTPTIVEFHSIISITLGVLLVGVTPGGFDVLTLLLVLGPLNISSAFLTYYQRKVKRYDLAPGLRVDALNMRIWTLLFLNLTFSGFLIPFLGPVEWQAMFDAFWSSLFLMIGSSISTFFALVFYVRALGRGSMSVVNSLTSISVLLGIPITLIGNYILPGAFGDLSSDSFLLIVKGFGIILVMIGVIALQASDVRAIVLIKVKPFTGDILPDLFEIKGVEKASAVAGDFDYLICIKSRSLGKTRTNILNKLNEIPEIKYQETLVVLQDYR